MKKILIVTIAVLVMGCQNTTGVDQDSGPQLVTYISADADDVYELTINSSPQAAYVANEGDSYVLRKTPKAGRESTTSTGTVTSTVGGFKLKPSNATTPKITITITDENMTKIDADSVAMEGGGTLNGTKTVTPPTCFPSNWRTLDLIGWNTLAVSSGTITEGEIKVFANFTYDNWSELSSGGQEFWKEFIGTANPVTAPTTPTGTICGISYTNRETDADGNIFYHLSGTYESALSTFGTYLGYTPSDFKSWCLLYGSSTPSSPLIFELIPAGPYAGYRLVPNDADTTNKKGREWRREGWFKD
jgi:hypothetical protein